MDKTNKSSIKDHIGQSDDLFKEIFDKSSIGILFYDKNGITVNANKSALEMLGFPRLDDVLGHSLFDNPFIEEKKDELLDNGIIRFQAPLDLEKIKDFSLYPNKKGVLFFDYTVSVTDSGYLVQINNIIEGKQVKQALQVADERFDLALNKLTDFFAICDSKWRYLYVNDAYTQNIGKSREQLLGQRIWDIIPQAVGTLNYENCMKTAEDRIPRTWTSSITFQDRVLEYRTFAWDEGLALLARDITKEKKAEEALLESEEKFKSLYSSITEGVAIHEVLYNSSHEAVDYIITDVNPAYENITGLKRREVIGKKASELYGTGKPPYMDIYSRVAESGEPAHFETYFEPMGKHFRIAVTSPDKGKFATFFDDITERKQAEEQIKNLLEETQQFAEESEVSNEELQATTEELHVSNDELRNQGNKLLRINMAYKALSNNSKAITLAKDEPDYLESVCKIIVEDCGYPMVWIGYAEENEDKKVRPVAYSGFEEGYLKMLNITWADTERGRGPTGRTIRTGNPSMCKNMLTDSEFKPWRDEAIKRGYISSLVLPLRNKNKVFGALNIYSQEQDPFSDEEVNLMTELANDIAYGINSIRLYIANIEAGKALRTAHNTLELKVQERTKELEKTNEELTRSNEELKSFAYITSHDLQEPLRSIASYAQLIQRRYEGQLDSDADEFIDFMVIGAKRMKSMIQGLLEYSRVGTQGEEFKDFNVEEALNDALLNLKSAIDECHAEVTYDSLPVVFGDESQITSVFQNLIGNALKFKKPQFPPRIHISAQKGNEYIFSIQDNGIGMEPQYTDKIFEVFKRLHTIDEYPGTGIGLAIAKRIIDRHGGHVWVESSFGDGSTFYFTIPVDIGGMDKIND